jgi:hypothetical protein
MATQIESIETAKRLLERASILVGRLEAAHAKYEARITPIKQAYEQATALEAAELSDIRREIEASIESHPEHFQRPRTVKTQWGEFGLRASQKLEIANPDQVVRFADRNGYTDIYETRQAIDKKAVQRIIRDGTSVPGADIVCEERPVVKVVPTLPDLTE